MTVGVVVNPVAGGGRMRREWPKIRQALSRHFSTLRIEETRGPGDASAFSRELAMGGADLVIAVGGDGTIGEVADALLQARAAGGPLTELAIFPVGTGSDLARSLGLPSGPEAVAERIASTSARPIDAGRVDYINHQGALESRHFINIASLGVSGRVATAVNASSRGGVVPAKAIFLWHTVRELIRYRFESVRVTIDGGPPMEARIALLAVANGRFFGGGMMIAPDAVLDDGLAEIVIVRGSSKFSLLKDLRHVYTGAHTGLPSCTILRGKRIVVEPLLASDGALLDIDGEAPGRIRAMFEILPKAISVRY